MKLPAALVPWAEHLGIFPAATAIALGPLVQRIALAIGPLGAAHSRQGDEPDGFDGLTRRGAYERLLLTELALADELPDEFMRRAIMGEHLFLNLARATPTGSRVSLALFDSGPNQLGAPRLAHLAALIVLARRAQKAGARFEWGLLQSHQKLRMEGITPATLMMLLGARCAHETTAEDLAGWHTLLADWPEVSDVWLVGAPRLLRLARERRFSHLHVSEVLEPNARQLRLNTKPANGAPNEVTLELPPTEICVRLIRDPFAEAIAGPTPTVNKLTQPQLSFAKNGGKLLARHEKCGVTLFNVPNSPKAVPNRPSRYHSRRWQPVVSAGYLGRGLALFTIEAGQLRLEYARQGYDKLPVGFYLTEKEAEEYVAPEESAPLLPCLSLPRSGPGQSGAYLLDSNGTLFSLKQSYTGRPSPHVKPFVGYKEACAWQVMALAQQSTRLSYVGQEQPEGEFVITTLSEKCPARAELPFTTAPLSAFFGYGPALGHTQFGLLALQQSPQQWVIMTNTGNLTLTPPKGTEVVGVMHGPDGEAALLVIGASKKELHLYGENCNQRLLETWQPIEFATVCPDGPYVAYALENSEVAVHSLKYNALVCRYLPPEAES